MGLPTRQGDGAGEPAGVDGEVSRPDYRCSPGFAISIPAASNFRRAVALKHQRELLTTSEVEALRADARAALLRLKAKYYPRLRILGIDITTSPGAVQ